MRGQRKKLDVGKSHFLQVADQAFDHLAIGRPAVALGGNAFPGAEMHFINRNRRGQIIALVAGLHPDGIIPFVFQVPNDRGAMRRSFAEK